MLTLCLVALGIGVAALLGWKVLLIFDFIILLLCCLDHSKTLKDGTIEAERVCPQHFSSSIEQDIEIVLRNTGPTNRKVQVRDQTPKEWEPAPVLKGVVPGRSSLSLDYRLTPFQRGEYGFGDLFLRVEGPLGLTLKPIRLKAAREVKSLREYVEGDDPRKIHWKATARLDRPIVQQYQAEKNQIVMILLDVGRLMSAESEGRTKLDHALEAAVHLAHTAISGGDQAGILAFADRVISFIPPRGTPEQLQLILEGTLSLRPALVEPQYEQALLWLRSQVRRRSLVVIYTDLLDEVASENLLDAVSLLRPLHLPLCVAIRESEWDELLTRPPSKVHGVYERAVLQELLRQRSKALGGLVRKGALAMDLPPSKLSIGTMERYLEVKRRGLL
jgi:uncharacterized protein (DUF58 family)